MTKHYLLSALCFLGLVAASHGQAIVTVTGTGTSGYSGDGGPANVAQVNLPTSVNRDFYGNLYIADRFNHRVRRVDAVTGIITTIAGTGTAGYSGDGGLAIHAHLDQPIGLAIEADGTIYISDNHNDCIRKIDPSGTITTYAGTGTAGDSGDGGPATAAQLHGPWGLALDGDNNLYIADRENDRVRMVDHATGVMTTVAGTGVEGYSGNGGPATAANFNKPISLALDTAGNLFIADEDNHRVRKVFASTGFVEKIAGNGTAGYNGDGIQAVGARLNYPSGVGVDNAGNVYIGDRGNHRIRKVTPSGIISTIAGTGNVGFSGDGGNATSAMLNYPRNLFADGSGNIYFADTDNDRIRKITFCNLPSIPVLAASQPVICAGEGTTLSVTSGSLNDATDWKWYSGSCGGTLVGTGISIAVTPAATTTYYVRGEGACATPYGCGTVTVQVEQVPDQPTAIVGDGTLCEGATGMYSVAEVTGATSYEWTLPSGWSGSSSTNSIEVTAGASGGNISVVAVNSCGNSAEQTLVMDVDPLPAQPGAITGNSTVCALSTGTWSVSDVSGATSYTWTLPSGWTGTSTTASIDATAGATGGSISVVTNNSCGSSPTQVFDVAIALVDTAVSFAEGVLTATASADAYQWVSCPSMEPINGAIDPSFTPDQGGSYAVTITVDGCSLTSGCHDVITTGIPASGSLGHITVAPNPTNGTITITALGIAPGIYQVALYDLLGQQLQRSSMRITGNNATLPINLASYPDGIYWVRISTGQGDQVFKVQKVR